MRAYQMDQYEDLIAGQGMEVNAPPQPAPNEIFAGTLSGNQFRATVVRDQGTFGGVYTGTLSENGMEITGVLTTPHDGVQPANWVKVN